MAISVLRAQVISRGSGHSAVAKAAYNAREALRAERYDKTEDYSRKADECLFRGFYAPKDAPEWARERERFWNAVEWREKRKDAQLGREFEIALPHELTAEQNRWLVQDFVRENFTRRGYVADVAIHAPSRDGDGRNIHAHVFVPLRQLDGDHWAEKKERTSKLERANELKAMRESWERLANRHLERHGFAERIDMRSYAEQGVDRTPGVHMGKEATGKERRGEATELGDRNRAAANENERRAANQNEPTAEQVAEAQERAAYVRQQRANAKAWGAERDAAMWDQSDGSTLDNIRKREREGTGDSRSTENEARRAMDDLARTDPHGTARHFGHRAGDRLKTPEDMRREMAERMRGFAAADPQPEPARDRAAPDPGRAPAAENQVKRPDPIEARAAWVAMVREAAGEAPQEAARGPEAVPGRDAPGRERERVRERPQERPGAVHLQAAVAASRQRLDGLSGRLDASLTTIRERLRDREAATVRQERPQAAPRPTVERPREAPRREAEPVTPQPQKATRPSAPITRTDEGPGTSGGRSYEDTSSRKVNRDFADEVLEEARRRLAQEAAAERGKAYDHDRQEREREGRELERVRELLRQERRAKRPHEPD